MNNHSNFTQIPQNSKVLKIGFTLLCLVFLGVFIAAFNFMLENSNSFEMRVYIWPIATIILFLACIYIFKRTTFKSRSTTRTVVYFRKTYSVLRNILIVIGLVGYSLNNNLVNYNGTGIFYKTFCSFFSLFNPQIVISTGLLFIIILQIVFIERTSRNIFWLFIWVLLFTASALLLPSVITQCIA